jgi:hypothetical protein
MRTNSETRVYSHQTHSCPLHRGCSLPIGTHQQVQLHVSAQTNRQLIPSHIMFAAKCVVTSLGTAVSHPHTMHICTIKLYGEQHSHVDGLITCPHFEAHLVAHTPSFTHTNRPCDNNPALPPNHCTHHNSTTVGAVSVKSNCRLLHSWVMPALVSSKTAAGTTHPHIDFVTGLLCSRMLICTTWVLQ